jgi:hypothetical protein
LGDALGDAAGDALRLLGMLFLALSSSIPGDDRLIV